MHKSFSSKKLTSSTKNSARNSVEGHVNHAFNKAVPKVGECPSKQPKQVNLTQKTRQQHAAQLARHKSSGSLMSDKENMHNHRNGRVGHPTQAKASEAALPEEVPFRLTSSAKMSALNAKIQSRVLEIEQIEGNNGSPAVLKKSKTALPRQSANQDQKLAQTLNLSSLLRPLSRRKSQSSKHSPRIHDQVLTMDQLLQQQTNSNRPIKAPKSARAGTSDSNLASILASGQKSYRSVSKRPSPFAASHVEVVTGFRRPRVKEYLTSSVLSSKANAQKESFARQSHSAREQGTGLKESALRDLSFGTEKVEDEPQPNCKYFEWVRPAKKSSKQWYEQQDGSQVVWQAGDSWSREQAPFSATSKITHTKNESAKHKHLQLQCTANLPTGSTRGNFKGTWPVSARNLDWSKDNSFQLQNIDRLDSGIRVTTIGEQLYPATSAFNDHLKTSRSEDKAEEEDGQASEESETHENEGLFFQNETHSLVDEHTAKQSTMHAIQ